jgi:hypothetical protein
MHLGAISIHFRSARALNFGTLNFELIVVATASGYAASAISFKFGRTQILELDPTPFSDRKLTSQEDQEDQEDSEPSGPKGREREAKYPEGESLVGRCSLPRGAVSHASRGSPTRRGLTSHLRHLRHPRHLRLHFQSAASASSAVAFAICVICVICGCISNLRYLRHLRMHSQSVLSASSAD